jgi:hypothetical protein
MGLIYVLLVTSIVLGGGAYYGYQARAYNFRKLAGGLFVITVVLMMFFMLARGS